MYTSNAGMVLNPGQTRFLGIRITRAAGANGTVTSPTNNNSMSNTLLKNNTGKWGPDSYREASGEWEKAKLQLKTDI